MPGFAFGCFASFEPFWPLALVQLALVAIILQALHRFRGAVLFRGLRSSSSWGFPFWLLCLTLRSSGPAFCGPLTLAVRPKRCYSVAYTLHKEIKMSMPAMPLPKNGACPSGYTQQGNMCVPNANAKPAIPRNGVCPSGWTQQGNYCVANTANPKVVIPKNGPCPSGYTQQGNYCVAIK